MDFKTKSDFISYLKSAKTYSGLTKSSKLKPVLDFLLEETSFMPEESSLSLRVKMLLSEEKEVPKCPVCKEKDRPLLKRGHGFRETCGDKECHHMFSTSKIKTTMLDRYGVEHALQAEEFKEKSQRTIMKNYGVESPFQSCNVRNKRRQTMLSRYGVEHASQHDDFKRKTKNTMLDRYGVDHHAKNIEIKEKTRDTNLERYGVLTHNQNKESLRFLINKDWLIDQYSKRTTLSIANELNVDPNTVWRWLVRHGITKSHHRTGPSQGEREVASFLDSLGIFYEISNRTVIAPYELDLYIPDFNIAIEYNGVFWHSERYKNPDYHQRKSLMCKESNILLIHIWSDDWENDKKKEILKQKIKTKLGMSSKLFGRKTSIVYPSVERVRTLYDNNHIQGFTGASVHIGLESEGELVACASFKSTGDGIWDLNRFSSSKTVIGGFSKILKEFKKEFEWNKIFTFAHLDYSHGDLYNKTGFKQIHITSPGMWYSDDTSRHRRERFMKHRISSVLPFYDESLTEWENMQVNGFSRIYDAGSIRYELTSQGHSR